MRILKLYISIHILCLLNASAIAQEQTNIDYSHPGAPMPPLKGVVYHYKDTSSSTRTDGMPLSAKEIKQRDKQLKENAAMHYITSDDLHPKGNIFIMLFNPNCSHCQEETIKINQEINSFKKSKFVLVANPEMAAYIPDFITFARIAKQPKLPIVIDSSGFVDKVFLYQSLPQINIYNKEHKLIKTYTGDVSIDSLKQYAQ